MISFDLFYGVVSIVLNFIAFVALLTLFLRLRVKSSRYSVLFIYSIFLKPKRFTVAFLSLFLASFFLTIGYVISFLDIPLSPRYDILGVYKCTYIPVFHAVRDIFQRYIQA